MPSPRLRRLRTASEALRDKLGMGTGSSSSCHASSSPPRREGAASPRMLRWGPGPKGGIRLPPPLMISAADAASGISRRTPSGEQDCIPVSPPGPGGGEWRQSPSGQRRQAARRQGAARLGTGATRQPAGPRFDVEFPPAPHNATRLSLADWGGSEARVIDCLVFFLQGCPRPFGFTAEVSREQRGARQRSPGLQGWGWWGAGSGRGRRVRAPRLLLSRGPLAQVVRALCASVSPLAPTLRKVVVSLEDTRPMKPAPVTLRRVGYPLN